MYECRAPTNYAFGTLSNAAAITDTTMHSADFATSMPGSLSTTIYVPMVLQDLTIKQYEIVWVTAHANAATSCTVVRGREGSGARAWPSGTQWLIGQTVRDSILPLPNRTALPTDPHIGMRAYLQDEKVALTWLMGTGWVDDRGLECHAAYKSSVTQTFASSVARKVFYGTAIATSPLVTATLGSSSTGTYFTLNRAGVWCIDAGVVTAWMTGLYFRALSITDDPLSTHFRQQTTHSNNGGCGLHVMTNRRFTAGARVAASFYHEQGSNQDVSPGELTGISLTWLGP